MGFGAAIRVVIHPGGPTRGSSRPLRNAAAERQTVMRTPETHGALPKLPCGRRVLLSFTRGVSSLSCLIWEACNRERSKKPDRSTTITSMTSTRADTAEIDKFDIQMTRIGKRGRATSRSYNYRMCTR